MFWRSLAVALQCFLNKAFVEQFFNFKFNKLFCMALFKVTAERYIGGKTGVKTDEDGKQIVIFNSKVIDKGASVTIQSDVWPSAKTITEAFKAQLGKAVKGGLSTDFFKIERE
jgi:hypothetical protein